MEDELLVAGKIGTPKGLKGEAAINLFTDRPEEVFAPRAVLQTNGDPAELTVKTARMQGSRLQVSFEEAPDRTAIERLVGLELLVEPVEEDDAWYPSQLQGLRVEDVQGETLGVVKDLRAGAAHDLLIVDASRGDGGGAGRTDVTGTDATGTDATGTDTEEVMVPFVHAMVPEVNVEEGVVVVDPPEGLFPGSDQEATNDEAQ